MTVQNHKWVTGLLLLSVGVVGCSSPAGASTDELTLAETKSPVQLLRNEAASRVDTTSVSEVRVAADASSACLDEFDNPGGLVRQWISSVDLVLAAGSDLSALADDLVASFEGNGWERRDMSTGDSFALTVLASPNSVAQIQVEASDESEAGVITITSTGPCVPTGGPDSDEVLALEGP